MLGVAGAAMFATPASAHTADLGASFKCDKETGEWVVTATLANQFSMPAKLSEVVVTGLPVEKNPKVVVSGDIKDGAGLKPKGEEGDTLTGTARVDGTATGISLSVKVTWKDKKDQVKDGTLKFEGTCVKDVVQPPPPPPPAPGPSPSPSATASAAPALPTTGSNTGLYAGGALVLGGAGAGLFLVARRRRIKFIA
jgi:LPXTG-motif cell wall-anchored protein